MDDQRTSDKAQKYRRLGQGLKIFHHDQHADVDIIAVPGLGAHPEECWTWSPAGHKGDAADTESFNWIRDPGGLASLFPNSRIMLYDYASAWWGSLKVRATMRSICTCLLDDLKEKRKTGVEATRPIVWIGHSMGGVVIAKALCMAMAKSRSEWENLVTCTTGCTFFGAPFEGSEMARTALLLNATFGSDAYESLLSFMRTEKNDALDEVKNDFKEITELLTPRIYLLCVWEQVATDIDCGGQMVSRLLKHKYFKAAASKMPLVGNDKHWVERESAVLHGARELAIPRDHREMIKFESLDEPMFAVIKGHLSDMISPAKIVVRKRLHSSGQTLLNQRFVNQVRLALEGVDMRQKYRAKAGEGTITSWLTSEPLYQQWLESTYDVQSSKPYLWLTGGSGLGKTNAALAAVQHLDDRLIAQQQVQVGPGQTQMFLAYFLCENATGYCTAEDVLKNLVLQMIYQEASLAHHAKWFVPDTRQRSMPVSHRGLAKSDTETLGTRATATVDNLWQCLRDMIDDPAVSSIHFVISNAHCLEFSDSTTALLAKLSDNAGVTAGLPIAERKARWLLTSRKDVHISRYLGTHDVAVIDLENNKEYGSKLSIARREHAKKAIADLRSTQQYKIDLAYYVRNSIESQSEDEVWIDVLCILLRATPKQSSNLTVTRWLGEFSQLSTKRMIDRAWKEILARNENVGLEIEELMQAVTMAYEPLSLADLAVLTPMDDTKLLRSLVDKCAPILQLETSGEHENKITFSNKEFAGHLTAKTHGDHDQSNSRTKQYHGLLAIRCFKHIKSFYESHNAGAFSSPHNTSLQRSSTISARVAHNTEVLVVSNEDEEPDVTERSAQQPTWKDCVYPVKYVFHHLNEGFSDVVDELFEEDPAFWGGYSDLREAWLKDFRSLMPELKSFNTKGMSALHVAAGIEAADLVSVLVSKCGKSALSWTSDDGLTALHIAATNKTTDVVDKLIRSGADIEAGDGDVGTALHFASSLGKSSTIALLLQNKANVNAWKQGDGPVINAAIQSGTVEAVKQIMACDVRFDIDYTKCESPLSLSAGQAEPGLFRQILESERDKWLQNAKLLDQALVSAAESGKLESVRILLEFQHIYTNNTLETSLLCAARGQKWPTVDILLDHTIKDTAQGNRRDIRLDKLFYRAVASKEQRLDILQKIWKFSGQTVATDVRDFSLYQACISRKTQTAKWLLSTCAANANATSDRPFSLGEDEVAETSIDDFSTVLNAAASTGNTLLVSLLIEKGGEIDATGGYALQLAAKEGHLEVVDTLLQSGADPNHKVADNDELRFYCGTALQAACEAGHRAVVEALLASKADPNLGGGVLAYPIVAATQMREPDVLMLLLEAPGIDINVAGGHDHSTPLINAATHMATEVIDVLIQKDADMDARNASGDTALIMAARRGDKDCLEMLCRRGADVTYRSPQHGLAIQVAAQKLHPLCADILSERMGETIERYREQVKIDPSKERLEEALAVIKEHEETIEGLHSELSDTKESLDNATNLTEHYKGEIDRTLSLNSLKGETYGSIGQQVKAMQYERIELQKQNDSLEGQLKLGNDTIADLRGRLAGSLQQNLDIKKRYGFKTLQEEKKVAVDAAEAERQKTEALQAQLLVLQGEVLEVQTKLEASTADLLTSQTALADAIQRTDAGEQQKEDLQSEMTSLRDEIVALKSHNQEVETVLASIQEAAGRNKAGTTPAGVPAVHDEPNVNGAKDYFCNGSDGPGGVASPQKTDDELDYQIVGRPVASPPPPLPSRPVASPPLPSSQPTSPQSPAGRPGFTARSPSSQTEGGFRTIHGQHRPDGSLGGYRAGKGMRRLPSGGINTLVGQGGVAERRSMSTESMGSNSRSANGSLEAPKEERVTDNDMVSSPKELATGDGNRVQWS